MAPIRGRLKHGALGKGIDGVFGVEGFRCVGRSGNVGMAFVAPTDRGKLGWGSTHSIASLCPPI
ncbi:hypothetical protein [Burkholderia alba]|uniref:hypothetical protein n=1 Tax=Burkholderia alba TaxID=2683677 RepID=UPI002B05F80C|nr:hypothetical protein [Burkholderia alba]